MTNPLDWPARRPGAALLLAVLATVLALLLILRLRPETSLQGLLDQSDPTVVAMGRVLEEYPVVGELLVLVTLRDGMPDDPAPLLAFADRLQSAADVDDAGKALISNVRYRAESQARTFVGREIVPNGLYYLADDQLAEVRRRLTRAGMEEQLARNEAMLALPGPAAGGLAKTVAKDPLRLYEFLTQHLANLSIPGGGSGSGGAFLSPDKRSLLIRIGGTRSQSDFKFAQRLTEAVHGLAGRANHDRLRLDVAGAYAMSAHSAERIQADSVSDVISTVIGLMILFALACRRPIRLFLFAFLPVAAGLLWGFGAYALLRHKITPLAAVVGGTLGAIGLDYTIHYITHYQQMRRKSPDAASAVWLTSRQIFLPSLAAWVTSVIGFAACAISPVRVLRDFAILGTLCLIGAWVSTLLVLPAMLARFAPADATPFRVRFDFASAVGHWIARRARGLLVGSALVLLVIIAALAIHGVRYELNSDPMALHPQPSPPLDAQRFIAKRMQVAAGSLIVHLNASSPAELVTLSHAVQRRLDAESVRAAGVTGVFGLGSLLPDPSRTPQRRAAFDPALADRVHADLQAALETSGFRPEAYAGYAQFLRQLTAPGPPPGVDTLVRYPELAQLFLPRDTLYGAPETAQHAPQAGPLNGSWNASRTPSHGSGAAAAEAVTLLFSREPLETRDAREGALTAVRDALRDVPGATVTGTAVIGHDLETALHRDVPRFVAVSLASILVYLLAHFRSMLLAAMALLPIAVSLLCVTAFISLAGVKLNLIHAVAAPLLLGINLDYGIFAVHAWRTARESEAESEGGGNRHGLAHSFPPAFAALVICGGSTTIGFGSLVLTSIPAVQSLGWLINVGVGTCVLSTLLVLWPALMLSRQPTVRRRGSEEEIDPQIRAD